jgi:hypothetical protein
MTIFALCCFAGDFEQANPDAAAEALRAAGYKVFRLPPALKKKLEVEGDDFIEIRREGNDDEDSRDAMEADAERIVSPFGGAIDPSGCVTIAELWTPLPDLCAHCGGLGTPDRTLLRVKVGENRAWLHRDCLGPGLDTLVEREPIPF